MIPKECKFFAEADFLTAVVSKRSACESSGKCGHQKTPHRARAKKDKHR
jgi:hypothetical protein